jgi:hypothetical protein
MNWRLIRQNGVFFLDQNEVPGPTLDCTMNDDRFLEFFVVGSQLNAHSSRPFLRLGLTRFD